MVLWHVFLEGILELDLGELGQRKASKKEKDWLCDCISVELYNWKCESEELGAKMCRAQQNTKVNLISGKLLKCKEEI